MHLSSMARSLNLGICLDLRSYFGCKSSEGSKSSKHLMHAYEICANILNILEFTRRSKGVSRSTAAMTCSLTYNKALTFNSVDPITLNKQWI